MTPADLMRIADLEDQVRLLTHHLAMLEWQALFNSSAATVALIAIFVSWFGFLRGGDPS